MLMNQDFTWDRAKYLGGSDIGAILGLSQYRTPLEVWQEKVGQKRPKADSLPLRFGSFAEEFIASEYARQTGQYVIQYPEPFVHPKYSFLVGHIDRFVLKNFGPLINTDSKIATDTLLECKTANHFVKDQWGDAGTDEVPLNYLVQCAWYLLLTGCERADLAVFFSSTDFRIYRIHKDTELEELLLEKAIHFWDQYVLPKIPPPPTNEGDFRLLYPKASPSKSVEASVSTLEALQELAKLNQTVEQCEARISQIKQGVMQEMQEAQSLLHDGKTVATWKQPKPSIKLDSKKLALDHPDLASQYQVAIANPRRLIIKDMLFTFGNPT